MKKLLLSLAVCSAFSANVLASPVTLDPTMDNDFSDAIVFDELDFLQMYPMSYYIDSTQDGYVNNGEFVFDFGNNVNLGAVYLDTTMISGSTFSGQYSLVADYLLIGEAVVSNTAQVAAANYLATIADFTGSTVNDIIAANFDFVGGVCTSANASLCNNIISYLGLNDDGKIDGDAGETLFANITDGLFNLFLTDSVTGDRIALAGSFDVSGLGNTVGSDGLFTLNILGEAIQATQDLLFSAASGDSFYDIIADANQLNPSIRVDTNIDAAVGPYSTIPGSSQSTTVGTSNAAGTSNAGDQLYYYTDGAYTAWDVTAEANGQGCSLGDANIPFGGCSGLIGDPSAADDKWDELKGIIRDAAGCTNANNCAYDLLARQTEADASASIEASSPGHLLLSGLALLVLGLRRRFA